MKTPRLSLLVSALAAALPLCAPGAAQTGSPLLHTSRFEFGVVPVHTRPAYGTWAGGRNYKVSFHEGFAFHLYGLDPQGDPRPWRWQTVAVEAGALSLLGKGEEPVGERTKGTQFQYRYRLFDEIYDVDVAGVEQSFVIHKAIRPEVDLRVRGAVTSPLRSEGAVTKAGALVFGEVEGGTRIEYGAAIAIDATGRTIALAREFEDGMIDLVVPAAWLQKASFPVTIDPFISGVAASYGATPILGFDLEPYSGHRALLRVARGVDVFAYLCRPDLSDPRLLYAHMAGASGVSLLAAFVDAPRRWVLAVLDRGADAVTVHFHDAGNTDMVSGGGERFEVPSSLASARLGGTAPGASGDQALFAFSTGGAYPGYSSFRRIDARTRTVDARATVYYVPAGGLSGGWVHDIEPSRGVDRPWLVCNEIAFVSPYYYPVVSTIRPDGVVGVFGGLPVVGALGRGQIEAVETLDGEYLVTHSGGHVWRGTATMTDVSFTSSTAALGPVEDLSALAYDPVADQVFVSVWTRGDAMRRLTRASRSLCIIDEHRVHPRAVRAHYDARARQFVTVAWLSGRELIVGYRLTHDTRAGSTPYGVGCMGTIESDHPYPAALCEIRLQGAPAGNAASLMLSSRRQTTAFGAAGCFLHVDPSLALSVHSATVSAAGRAAVRVRLPDCPVFLGQLYAQWTVIGADSVFRTSAGLKLTILP